MNDAQGKAGRQRKILLVEDERHIAHGLVFNLEQEGYLVAHCESGEAALARLAARRFDLIILDLMLPGMSGFEVCERIRRLYPRLPVLMLTAMVQEEHRIRGLSSGADDYLTKPFSLAEFLLRVRGMLRRSLWYDNGAEEREIMRFGGNEVLLGEQRAKTAQGEISLTELEVRVLRCFRDKPDRLIPRSELLSSAWGVTPDTETRTLDNFIVRLRRYFEPDPASPVHFITVRGRGYRFKP